MAGADAEVLESLLSRVMRLAAVHGDEAGGHVGVPVSPAEVVLLTELLATGEATQQHVAERLHVDKSRVSRLCASLEGKGLLTREREEGNRRNRRVRITEAGVAAATHLRREHRELHERLLSAMSPDERRALLVGLGALVRVLGTVHQGRFEMDGRAR